MEESKIKQDQGQKLNIQRKNVFVCSNHQQADQFCYNEKCKQSCSYICENKKCACQKEHRLCGRGRIQTVLQIIDQKIKKSVKHKNQIQSIIDKAIDQLSNIKDKFNEQFQSKYKFVQLSGLQKSFYDLSQKKQKQSMFNSQKLSKLWIHIQTNSSINLKISQFQNSRTKMIQQAVVQHTKNTSSILQKIYKTFQNQSICIQTFKKQQLKKFLFKSIRIQNQIKRTIRLASQKIFKQEQSIIQTQEDIAKLLAFFGKKVQSTNLLFKASQNNFSMKNFYNQCGAQNDIMFICKTNKDKIIGAYTPLSLNPYNQDQYASDPSNSSFIFSLTNNHKFILKNNQGAIYRVKNKQKIKFGDDQLNIQDKANQKSNSTYVNYAYYFNQNYIKSNNDSYQKFNGNQSVSCTFKQWQAWKICFTQ